MMATGSGKTKAALYSMAQLDSWQLLLICVPGIELVEQWEADVSAFFSDITIIQCSSLHPNWKQLLLALIQAKIPKRTVVISTYDSAISDFSMDKWKSIKRDQLALICDEVHNIALLISWFICAILLYIFNLFNGYCGILLIISSIPILLSVWTLRCPKCGAWIAKQTPIWEFLHYNCKICGFSADESDKRE